MFFHFLAGLLLQAFASFVKIWESQLPLYAIQAASISKWVETTSSTLNSAALYVSGSILDRGRDILNSCSYCTCTKNMPSIDNSVLRWNRKTSFGRNNVQPIESALCPYCLLGLTLTAGWSEIGIWPSFQNLDCFGLENEENKRSGSILSCFGLGFVCDFSINIVQFLNFVVKLKSNQEVCDIGSFTSVHVRETVDLIYQFYSRNNVLAMQSSSNIHEVGQQIDEYFKTFWRNSISAECKIEEILSISHGWCLLNSCVRSILSEYDASGVGWRVGKVGKAENMDSRMAAYCDALRSALAAISTHVVVTPTETKDSNNLALENPFCFTSLSAIVSKSAILLLDTALKIISDKAKTESIGCAKLDSRYDVIVKHINNVAAIMSLMSYEQFLFLASRSALSFIAVLTETKISGLYAKHYFKIFSVMSSMI